MNREEGPRTRSQQHSSPVFTVKFDPSPTTTFNNLGTGNLSRCVSVSTCPTRAVDIQLFLPSNIVVIGVEIWSRWLSSLRRLLHKHEVLSQASGRTIYLHRR